jgi:RNA polymerase sigma-70 factor, ECF subfamily
MGVFSGSPCQQHLGARSSSDPVGRLYRTYGALVYGRCRHILRGHAAAEDATQETFLRVHRNVDALPEVDRIAGWLYRIATNLCFNLLRDEGAQFVSFGDLPETADQGPEERLANRDLAARLIARAPSEVRAVVQLCYLDGMHQEEIAALLTLSRRTIAKRLADFKRQARRYARHHGSA